MSNDTKHSSTRTWKMISAFGQVLLLFVGFFSIVFSESSKTGTSPVARGLGVGVAHADAPYSQGTYYSQGSYK